MLMKNFTFKVSITLAIVFCFQNFAGSENQNPARSPASSNWKEIAQSNLIVRGRFLQNPSIHLSKKSRESLCLISLETLKGKEVKQIKIDCVEEPNHIKKQFGDKEVIALLIRVNNERTKGFYLVESLQSSILPLNEQKLKLIRKEILNQKLINDNFQNLSISKPDNSDKKVEQLLNGLLKSDTQSDSWKELLNLNSKAIPALVRCMDDKRVLPPPGEFNSFSRNKSEQNDHFQYSPKIVQDAVSILLNQMTRLPFSATVNGGTADERSLNLSTWKVWLYYYEK